MNTTSLKRLLDTCFTAKRLVEKLPELPSAMKPRHIHVLDAVWEIQDRQGMCRVSDVAVRLGITMPSITKLIQELEKLELLEKKADKQDRRVILLELTDAGKQCVQRHVIDFHGEWAEALTDISDEQAEEAIRVIERLRLTMPRHEKQAQREE